VASRRVSIISLHYPPEATGVAPYAAGLAAGLSARGHQVTTYAAQPFYPEWRHRPGYGQWKTTEVLEGVTINRRKHYVPRTPRGVRRLLSELSFGFRLLASELSPDSVVVAVSPALFATAMVAIRIRLTPRRPRLVVWVQDIYTIGLVETMEGGPFSTSITKFVERFVLRAADQVVVIHPRFAEDLVEMLHIDQERITVIRNWTHLEPTSGISQRDARASLGWPTDVFLAVHTGTMGAKTGLANVVEAARLADEAQAPIRFVLVGDGGERAELENLARGVHRIDFVDPLDDKNYLSALAAADCLLVNELPGVAAMASPSKLTSYFDAGRPIVAATDPQGITAAEIKQSSAGIVVPAGNPAALLSRVLKISEDMETAAQFGAAGRRYRLEVLDSDAAISTFENLIEEVAER